MRIAEMIGTVTLSRRHPLLAGGRLVVVVPCSLEALRADGPGDGEDVVAWDELGASVGNRVALSESAEAAAPFHPKKVPVDAYCAALLDRVSIQARG